MALPAFGFDPQLALSRGGETVKLCFTIFIAFTPLRLEESFVFQPIQSWIERTLLNLQVFYRQLLNSEQNSIAVLRAK
jgi:hypothetical protein